ncbi:MAG: bifunctional (p)ppGpp synthetase/guanosine-3',5'-bis(diphosphate) 3'-pyrophosphohydrolase, partial [Prevotella sp.]|nr:bifunctional (p)ppGpp synthetase/guanosine-3',5'-bis(diphosphate) 3'-pyrophosphohydrolase [Prevotella sp.]
VKMNLFASEVLVFTPKGETIKLPKGATVLDLAFTLHTDLGAHCIAAKVNHALVPNTQRLNSGDQVEIITSNAEFPKPEWEKFLVTAKGKRRLNAVLRHQRRAIITPLTMLTVKQSIANATDSITISKKLIISVKFCVQKYEKNKN